MTREVTIRNGSRVSYRGIESAGKEKRHDAAERCNC